MLPAKALVVNALSITASFGALVWIFQDGNLSALLGFAPLGFVETTLPVILFCVLFGLSMDYEVFLLSRMKEVYDKTGDNREAVIRGMERSGRIVIIGSADRRRRRRLVRVRRHRPDQGAWPGRGHRRGARRDARPRPARAVDDAPSGQRQLVVARPAQAADRYAPSSSGDGRPARAAAGARVVAALVVGCSPTGQVLANPPPLRPVIPTPAPTASRAPDPQPISLPRDEAPHDRLTEWWYYTGHLATADRTPTSASSSSSFAPSAARSRSRGRRTSRSPTRQGNRFLYDQRSEIGPQVIRGEPGRVSSLGCAAANDAGVPDLAAAPWPMSGVGGHDTLSAATAQSFGSTFRWHRSDRRRCSTMTTAGWTSDRPAVRITTHGRG